MELVVLNTDLIEYHRRKARETKFAAVNGIRGGAGTFEARESYRFHCDAVDSLEAVNKAVHAFVPELLQQLARKVDT